MSNNNYIFYTFKVFKEILMAINDVITILCQLLIIFADKSNGFFLCKFSERITKIIRFFFKSFDLIILVVTFARQVSNDQSIFRMIFLFLSAAMYVTDIFM